ncbi:MAG: 5-carboxymethyl-2-hydroxymuconate Delta-isomerase [Pseudomonadales bacterium]|nr:5-carboxymethyl-2-hydroxymuconate Delta-isomerase [Pseudomonadales bacterium]
MLRKAGRLSAFAKARDYSRQKFFKVCTMPHFVIDCAAELIGEPSEETVNRQVHEVAAASKLFDSSDIKVRVNPYRTYLVGGEQEPFIHVFAHALQGRTPEQRAALSRAVVGKLVELFPEVTNIAMSVSEFEQATYCHRKHL